MHVFRPLEAATHASILIKMRKIIKMPLLGKYHIGLTCLRCSYGDAVTAVVPEVRLVDNLPWCTWSTGTLDEENCSWNIYLTKSVISSLVTCVCGIVAD